MRLDNLPIEILRTCLGYLDIVDEHGRDHVAQTNQALRDVAVDSFAHHQRLSMRFPAYAARPSNSILLPKPGKPDVEQVALASRRAWAFHSVKERLEHFFNPEQRQRRAQMHNERSLQRAIVSLSIRERNVLDFCMANDLLSFRGIEFETTVGAQFNISRARARDIGLQIIRKLRSSLAELN